MAKPQLEDGHTRIANEILEQLMKKHLSPNQWRVLLCIIRKTYGFRKKVDYIANFQIVGATGLGKTVVSKVLRDLYDMQLITRKGKYIGFQKDWEKWRELAKQSTLGSKLAEQSTVLDNKSYQNSQPELAEQSTKVSSPRVTQKKKETIQKKGAEFFLPDWIDPETWDGYLEMRRKKKAAPTEHAKVLIIKRLEQLRCEGQDPSEVLNQSVMNSWTGVFPLKRDREKFSGHGRQQEHVEVVNE